MQQNYHSYCLSFNGTEGVIGPKISKIKLFFNIHSRFEGK